MLGAEALVRWIKGNGSILLPSEFINFAEKNGLISGISNLVIDEVCNKVLLWIKKGYKDFTISINITAEHLTNENNCKNLIARIKSYHIPPQYIEFEITESMIINDFGEALKNIQLIKEFGIKISMDDFGTGYSSLNYLKKLPIDIVKIDKSFIDAINEEEKDKVIFENIINICHSFKYAVVAEGVEDEEQFETLKKMQCDIFQGYYFGKPVDENVFESRFLHQLLILH
ncbi:putative signaling protein [bioreactor metagenome]|uniref:Putative signaling protein n=1 Tax=bioreactor metagenome TaxID=1076179 RepID=A0A645GGK0_9ZZZZ